MLDSLLVFCVILIGFWYWKSFSHPKDYPPGPRLPLPFVGDGYVLGSDLDTGFKNLSKNMEIYVDFGLDLTELHLLLTLTHCKGF